jgi:hypothetical protein
MPIWFVLMLAGTAALVVAKKAAAHGLSFEPGTYLVCLPPGTDPGLLRVNFASVAPTAVPGANGTACYQVVSTSSFTTTVLPSGTTATRVA